MSEYPIRPYLIDITDLIERTQNIISQNLDQRYDGVDVIYKYLGNFPKRINDIILNEAWDYEIDAHRFAETLSMCHQFFSSIFEQLSIFEEVHDLQLIKSSDQTILRFMARPIQF